MVEGKNELFLEFLGIYLKSILHSKNFLKLGALLNLECTFRQESSELEFVLHYLLFHPLFVG